MAAGVPVYLLRVLRLDYSVGAAPRQQAGMARGSREPDSPRVGCTSPSTRCVPRPSQIQYAIRGGGSGTGVGNCERSVCGARPGGLEGECPTGLPYLEKGAQPRGVLQPSCTRAWAKRGEGGGWFEKRWPSMRYTCCTRVWDVDSGR